MQEKRYTILISDRRSTILSIIIEHYIRTGEPMGSKTLCEILPYPISSATIRNEMAFLSELGLLEQRHTSGGRVPSERAYRFYVDTLMVPKPVESWETEKINQVLSVNASDPDRLLADAANLLSDLTNCASFYSTSADELDCIQGIELIPSGNNKAMIVMLTVGGKVKSSICKTSCPIDDNFRLLFYKIVNNYFIGTPISDISLSMLQSTSAFAGERIFELLPVLASLCSLCLEAAKSTVEIKGEMNLLKHEEFSNELLKILSLFANRKHFLNIINLYSIEATRSNDLKLFIGSENEAYDLNSATVAIASYDYNDSQKASLGIVGSTKINYNKILPRVDYITKIVKKHLEQGGVSNG